MTIVYKCLRCHKKQVEETLIGYRDKKLLCTECAIEAVEKVLTPLVARSQNHATWEVKEC